MRHPITWTIEKSQLLEDHILSYFKDGYDSEDPIKNLKSQMQYSYDSSINNPKIIQKNNYYKVAKKLAQGGLFLIYNDEIEEFLVHFYTKRQLSKIENIFDIYCDLIAIGIVFILTNKKYKRR